MKDKLTDEQCESIIKTLRGIIDTGPWDKSSFLSVVGKNLRQILDAFSVELGAPTVLQQQAELRMASKTARELGMIEVYVSLYSSSGNDMLSWERILASLPRQIISRPIYREEGDVKNAIRTKEHTVNEAYVAVLIQPDDILAMPPDKVAKDRYGVELLSLKDRSIQLDFVNRFVHQNSTYAYERGHLKKIGALV